MKITVPARLMQTYKECFFDETYFKGLPRDIKKSLTNVVDIGANVGYFSLSVFSIAPEAKVFAYEPMPNNFDLLKKYQSEHSNLDFNIINKAVSGRKETLVLHYDANDSYTTAASIFEDENQPNQIEVGTTTLEEIIAGDNLTHIDFLKLDCEGSEYEIIYGAPASVLEKISIIAIETHRGQGDRENIGSLSDFLRQKNFEINILRSKIWAWRASL